MDEVDPASAEEIRRLRDYQRLTVKRIAAETGIHPVAVAHVLRGREGPPPGSSDPEQDRIEPDGRARWGTPSRSLRKRRRAAMRRHAGEARSVLGRWEDGLRRDAERLR